MGYTASALVAARVSSVQMLVYGTKDFRSDRCEEIILSLCVWKQVANWR